MVFMPETLQNLSENVQLNHMLVSIITATNNSGATLEQCITSVLGQTWKNIEYIIIDNCSTDGTLDIARSYQDKISRIVSEPDKGIFDALNKGIRLSTGDIIGFLHADDFYTSNQILQKVVDKFMETGSDAVYGDLNYVGKNNPGKIVRKWVAGPYDHKKILNGWMPPHPSLFIKRKCYKNFGYFNTGYKIAADYELILRFLAKNKISISYLPEVLVNMRTGGTSNSSLKNIIRKSSEDLKALKEHKIGNFYTLVLKNLRKLNQFFPLL